MFDWRSGERGSKVRTMSNPVRRNALLAILLTLVAISFNANSRYSFGRFGPWRADARATRYEVPEGG